jgi:hypothetical protein
MTMNSLTSVTAPLFLFTFLASVALLAQEVDDGIGMEGHMHSGSLVFETAVVDGPRTGEPVVAGQPYSAVQVSEHTETLANGTNIHQKWETARWYRDAQGRTRTERFTWAGALPVHTVEPGPRVARISDPVAGYVYVLDLRNHVAHRLRILTGAEASKRVGSADGADATSMPREQTARQKVAGTSRSGGVFPNPNSTSSSQRPEIKQEALGKDVTDGVEVVVRRVTMTTPTGLDGNDQPLVRVCENQYSEELKLTILSKCSDPRAGDSATRLENVERTDPDPALFQVPADYTVVDEVDQFRIDLGTAEPNKER